VTFLAPVAGLIALALSVPVFIAIYLLKLRRRTLRVSSTLLWEQSVRDLQANVPLRWLKVSLPFLLQLLALLALITALARPAVPTLAPTSPRVVIIIDRSASMNALDGVREPQSKPIDAANPPPSRLDQATREALHVIADLGSSAGGRDGSRPRAMVIALAAQARVVRTFTDDLRELRDAVNAITPTDQPGDLAQAWPLVRAALAGEDSALEQSNPATVLLISDGSFDAPVAPSLGGAVRLRLLPVGDQGASVNAAPSTSTTAGATPASTSAPTPTGPFFNNRAIVALGITRDPESPSTVRVFVRIQNSDAEPRTISVQARPADNTAGLLGALPLTLPAATHAADGALTPGEAAGTIVFSRPSGGLITVSLSEPDLLASDNTVAFTLAPMGRPRVLVVGPGGETGPLAALRGEEGIDRALLAALREMDLGDVRAINIARYHALTTDSDAGARQGTPANTDLIIFDRVAPDRLPVLPTISIGAGLPIPELRVEPAAAPSTPTDSNAAPTPVESTRIISWRRTHPILRYAPLDSVLIAPPMRMTITEPVVTPAFAPTPSSPSSTQSQAPAPTREVTPLAFGARGPLIALVQDPGIGAPRRLVLAMDLLRTNWGSDVSFPIFFASAIEFLTGRAESDAGRFFTTDAPLSIAVPPSARASAITILGPDNTRLSRDVPASTGAEPVSISFGIPERVGAYTVDGATGTDNTFCVNLLNATESTLDIRPDLFQSRTPDGVTTNSTSPAQPDTARRSVEDEPALREIWPPFVLAALVLLAIEWFLFAWRSRV
jgi:hypothetical protein